MTEEHTNTYEINLDQTPANYVPLTPLTWIERAAAIYPETEAIVHGARKYTWSETFTRCRKLCSALTKT